MSWDIPIGTEFAGYKVTGVLGRGGMSIVYSAEHLSLGRTVALKVLSAALAGDDDFRERFIRESKLAATLEHPNIIPIYDAGEAEGCLFIAMRYVEGGDLGSLIKANDSLGLGQTIFLIEQVAGALDHAHRQGLVHRDVKPANILVERPSDRAYLTDFGVVKQTATPGLTKTGYFLGTFAYAAPEQIERKPVDGRTDLYALGCVLHECLSGEPPFNAVTEASILHAHLVEPPPRLTDTRPDLPHAIDDVIATALAKSKDDRYATCGELVKALRAVALGTTRVDDANGSRVAPAVKAVPETVLSRSETPPAEPPAAAPPPPPPEPADGAGSAPPPPEKRTPRTVTLSARRLAALAAGVVAVAAGAVIAVVLLTGGGGGEKQSAAAGTSPQATSPTSQGTSATTPAVATGLAGVIPAPLFKFCTKATPSSGAAETVVCRPPATPGSAYYPDSWQLSLYPSTAAVDKAYDALRRANDIGTDFGQCNGISWGGEGKWAHGPGKPGGSRFCYFDGNVAVIVWTHEKLGQASHIDLLGIARSNGSDHSNLFNWYRFWHHRLGKCDAPGCVATL
jgi:predicted Ser/Thr protein kinase